MSKIKLRVEAGNRGIGLIRRAMASECCNTPSRDPEISLQDMGIVPYPKGTSIMQSSLQDSVTILHELDLGQHTLFIMSDGSIDLLANDEQTYTADNLMSLDSDETYCLFISLQEQFKQKEAWL